MSLNRCFNVSNLILRVALMSVWAMVLMPSPRNTFHS
ncbi:hypothetical protein SAMN05216299_11237 [Nitrosospira sp. Nsp14]|nr:hypothetical protein SAMN05216299_11237 [Nitrosospira sp. Nsp14]